MSKDSVRPKEVIALAVGNVNRYWKSMALLLVLMFACSGVGFLAGAGTLRSHLASEVSRRESGSNVLIARSFAGISAWTCDDLDTVPDIVFAGSIVANGAKEIAPGIDAETGEVSIGFGRLLGDFDRQKAIVGQGLAARMGVVTSRETLVLTDRGDRTEQFTSWYLAPEPARQLADECRVEFTDEGWEWGAGRLQASLGVGVPDMEIVPLVFDPGPHHFNSSLFHGAGLVAGMLIGLAGSLVIRIRRIDLAMYQIIGWSRPAAMLVSFLEVAIMVWTSVIGALGVWVIVAMFSGPLVRPVVAATIWILISQLLVSSFFVLAAAAIAVRSSNLLGILRSGA